MHNLIADVDAVAALSGTGPAGSNCLMPAMIRTQHNMFIGQSAATATLQLRVTSIHFLMDCL